MRKKQNLPAEMSLQSCLCTKIFRTLHATRLLKTENSNKNAAEGKLKVVATPELFIHS